MSTPPSGPAEPPEPQHREWLSALADGQADPAAVAQAGARWADDPDLRQAWHDYHLIGDVLRSQELASAPSRDRAFLEGVRQRLQDEPVVLAPAPLTEPVAAGAGASPSTALVPGRLPRWLFPVAAAAGVAAVAGVLVVTRLAAPGASPEGAAPVLAGSAAQDVTRVGLEAAPTAVLSADGKIVRDPRIDAYLRAHRDARGPGAVAVPGAGIRHVDLAVPER